MKIALIGENSFLGKRLAEIHNINEDQILYYSARFGCKEDKYYLNISVDVDIVYYFPAVFKSNDSESLRSLFEVNTMNVLKLINTLKSKNIKCLFFFPSTRLVYGSSPLRQREDSTLNPISDYAVSKYLAESVIKNELSGDSNITYAILRLGVIYSNSDASYENTGTLKFMKDSLADKGCISLYGDGSLKRTFTNIDDVCSVFFRLSRGSFLSGIYNCGGQDLSLKEVAYYLTKDYTLIKYEEWPKEALRAESGSTIFDSKKLDDLLNFEYQLLIEE
jgi:UDP-glucose 4-epimerase